MKAYRILAAAAVLALSLSACGKLLDVHNPNYFTDEEMQGYIADNPSAEDMVLAGLTSNLYSYIHVYDAATNGGYSNSGAYESYKDFTRTIQSGDMVEGDALNAGTFTTWYQNLPSNTYWYTDQEVTNYGYYYGPVLKIGAAQKALDFLTPEAAAKTPKLMYSRAQALTLKAVGYMMLMERYTDLNDVTSTTAKGWPVYDLYAYNAPVAPLSVAETWTWINDTFAEAADLFHKSSLGVEGYTTSGSSNEYFDIDCGVCQYYRCRAAIDSKEWKIAQEAGEDLMKHYPNFIAASNYGMPADKLAKVQRAGVSEAKPFGTAWMGEYPADENGLICTAKNPETIFGNADATSTTPYWTVLGLNCVKSSPSGYYQMDKNLYDVMDDNDCRKACILPEKFDDLVVFSHNGADTTWYKYSMPAYTSLKWGATCGLGQTSHDVDHTYANSSYLRSSAVLLMLAEAYAQDGNEPKCKEWLGKLLAARSLNQANPMTYDRAHGGSALEKVQYQWRIEMWGEGDWAFFNRKRWGQTSYSRGSNHWSKTDIPSEGWTWQIPQKERQGNPYWN